MGSDYAFIYERTRLRRVMSFIIALVVVVALIVLFSSRILSVGSFSSLPWVDVSYHFFEQDVRALTPLGIFYITFLGDLFFNPVPPELFFYAALYKGGPLVFLLVAAFTGFLFANVVNYLIGRRCSIFFMHLASKKHLYRVRRYVNRYGAYAVFIFNVLPLPAPLLTFALGMARYNRTRLFTFLILGSLLKHAAIIAFYFLVS